MDDSIRVVVADISENELMLAIINCIKRMPFVICAHIGIYQGTAEDTNATKVNE